jgi:hypothetical protein
VPMASRASQAMRSASGYPWSYTASTASAYATAWSLSPSAMRTRSASATTAPICAVCGPSIGSRFASRVSTSQPSAQTVHHRRMGIPLVFVEGNADLTPAKLVGHHNRSC